jgi:tetratricopeptide (TPR) repeat protein
VYLERRPGSTGLALAWKDTTYALVPVDSGFTLPLEDLQHGRFEQAAERLRTAQASGFKLDSWITGALTTRADTLEEMGRPHDALRPARLAEELFPQSWRARARLGYTYKALGQTNEARRAFRKVQSLNPARFEWAQKRIQDLNQTSESKAK